MITAAYTITAYAFDSFIGGVRPIASVPGSIPVVSIGRSHGSMVMGDFSRFPIELFGIFSTVPYKVLSIFQSSFSLFLKQPILKRFFFTFV